jgi:hydrogenase/urease accessory protein HupE
MSYKNNKQILSRLTQKKPLCLLGLLSLIALPLANLSTSLTINSDWGHGFQHPLQGWDHLLTMIAVGIWAAQMRGQAIWLLPLTFVSVMSLGGLAGAASFALPSVEIMILLSGLVFSVFIARKVKFTTRINVLIVAFFAFFHGYVHGQEISASASLMSYTVGFVIATLLLHGTGIAATRLITLAFAFFVGSNVHAQETEISTIDSGEKTVTAKSPTINSDPVELEEVVVTAKQRADSLLKIADSASQGQVGQAQLKYRPITRPAEVLETVPGLIATQHSGEGKANQYFLRGFNLDHGTDFLTQIEGVPVNTVSHSHGQGWTDTNFLIPELVETLDYKKGNHYAENGDFSSTGSANIHYFRSLPENILKYTGGSFDYHRGLIAGSHKIGEGNLLYAGETVHNNGPWTVGNQYWKFNGVLGYSEEHEDHGWSVTAMAMKSDWNSTDQIARRAAENGTIGRFDALDPTDGGDSQRYSLTGEWHRQDADSETKLMAFGLYSKLDLFSNFPYFLDNNEFSNPTGCRGLNGLTAGQKFNPALFNTCGDQFGQPDERWTTGFKASHTIFHKIGSAESETTFGLQFRNDNIKNALTKTHAQQEYDVTRQDQIWQSSLGGYVENKTRWLDWLRTNMGVRLDGFRFDVSGSNIGENNGERYDGMVSPKLGIVFGPWADTEFYLNGGLGYHSNDARGINTRIDPTSSSAVDRADPLVRSYSAEIGARTTIIDGLQSTLAIWWLDLDSELVFVGDAGTTEAGRPSRRYGLEFNNYYSPTDWLTFDADFSFSEARFRDNAPEGNIVPNSVETVIAAGATFHDVFGGFFGGPRIRYFGPRNLEESGNKKSDDTLLVSAVLGYEVNKNISFQAEVYNILDRQDDGITYYYGSRLPGENAAGVDDFHFHPVEPVSFRMGFTAKF